MEKEVLPYLQEFLHAMEKSEKLEFGGKLLRFSCFLQEEAQKITSVLNQGFHSQKEIRQIFGKLTLNLPDKNFKLSPPFYTDCGKNIHLGKRIFINAGCFFQDQGGIFIGDDVQIGHDVKILTLNHGKSSSDRKNLYPSPVKIEENVWIGSGAVILPGVTIHKNAIVGAGSVVTKDVEENCVAAGNPATIIEKF